MVYGQAGFDSLCAAKSANKNSLPSQSSTPGGFKLMQLADVFKDRVFTLSNLLSFLRPFLLPPFLYYSKIYHLDYSPTTLVILLIIVFLATISDFLDGYLARRWKQESRLGRYLDPVSDKIVTTGALATLVAYFDFPFWIFIVYLLREAGGIWVGYFLFYRRNQQGKPNSWGKWGMGLASLNVLWYILKPQLLIWDAPAFFQYPEIAAYAFLFVLAGGAIAYARQYGRIIFHPEKQ